MKGIVMLMWRKLRLGIVAFVAFAAATLVPPRAQATNPIWINPMTCNAPIATYYLGDSLSTPWYVNLEIGRQNWNSAQAGYGPAANILSLGQSGDEVTIKAAGIPGFTYRLQTATSLAPVNWQDVSGSDQAASDTGGLTFTHSPGGLPPCRYYRTKFISAP